MKFTYFKADHMTTIEEAKRQYHRLCLRWHHGELTMDEIRNRFGSQKVETEKQAALTA